MRTVHRQIGNTSVELHSKSVVLGGKECEVFIREKQQENSGNDCVRNSGAKKICAFGGDD